MLTSSFYYIEESVKKLSLNESVKILYKLSSSTLRLHLNKLKTKEYVFKVLIIIENEEYKIKKLLNKEQKVFKIIQVKINKEFNNNWKFDIKELKKIRNYESQMD